MIENFSQVKNFVSSKIDAITKTDEKQQIGIGGYVAGVRLKEEITYTSNITTNAVEDGTDIADHIITLPIIIKIEGEVGDIEIKDNPKYEAFKKLMRNAGVITKYLPSRTATQTTKITALAIKIDNTFAKLDEIVKDGNNIYNMFNDKNEITPISERQKFFDYLTKLWETKQIFDIEMQHRTYKNMAIVMLTLNEQNGNYISYELTVQEVRFAKIIIDNSSKYFSSENASSEAKNTVSSKKNKGTVTATDAKDKESSIKVTQNKSLLKVAGGLFK